MAALLICKFPGDEAVDYLEHPIVGDRGYQVIGGINVRDYFLITGLDE